MNEKIEALKSSFDSELKKIANMVDLEALRVSIEKFRELLQIGFDNSELGKIPLSQDMVILGDTERSRNHQIKALFIVGMNDGAFPKHSREEGFLNDKDREFFRDSGLSVAKDSMELLYDVQDEVISRMNAYDADAYTAADVLRALRKDVLSPEDFGALLSPAALPFLEQVAQRAQAETRKHFGNSVQMFTPLYIANYCENYCIYCGFNCHNKIRRAKLDMDEVEQELKAIAETGLQEILILTGESRAMSPVSYIGEAVKLARKYFRVIGIEIYPLNVDEYAYLHECGVDYVTVFQETYDDQKYKTLHLGGHKRIFPYRLNAQERALMGGMRGVGFAALLGLSDFRKDAFATGLHAYLLQRKYPHAEIAFSCPRLRPIINNLYICHHSTQIGKICFYNCQRSKELSLFYKS